MSLFFEFRKSVLVLGMCLLLGQALSARAQQNTPKPGGQPAQGGAGQQQQQQVGVPSFELVKACLLPQDDPMLAGVLQRAGSGVDGVDPNFGKYNMKCDHQRLLREGASIHGLNFAFQNAKLNEAGNLIGADGKKATDQLLQHLAFDGTCFFADVQLAKQPGKTPADGGAQCLSRLARFAADADLGTRTEVMRLNAGRRDVLAGKDDVLFDGDVKGGMIQSKDISSNTILKDVKAINAQQQKLTPQQMLAQTQLVNFGNQPPQLGQGIKDAHTQAKGSDGILEAQRKNLTDINPTLKGSDGGGTEVEVASESKTQAKSLSKTVGSLNGQKVNAVFSQDQKDMQDTINARKNNLIKPDPSRKLVSVLALDSVMQQLNSKAGSKSVDTLDADVSISSAKTPPANARSPGASTPGATPTATPPPKPLDKTSEDAINSIRNSFTD